MPIKKVVKKVPTGNLIWNEGEGDKAAPIATLKAKTNPRAKTGRKPPSPLDDAPMGTGRELRDEATMTLAQARMILAAEAVLAANASKASAEAPAVDIKGTEPTAVQRQTAEMSAHLLKRVTINLEDSPDIPPTGLYIGYNGVPFMLKPGIDVSVPLPLCEILDNCRTFTAITDAASRIIGYRPKLRFPYREIRRAA